MDIRWTYPSKSSAVLFAIRLATLTSSCAPSAVNRFISSPRFRSPRTQVGNCSGDFLGDITHNLHCVGCTLC